MAKWQMRNKEKTIIFMNDITNHPRRMTGVFLEFQALQVQLASRSPLLSTHDGVCPGGQAIHP